MVIRRTLPNETICQQTKVQYNKQSMPKRQCSNRIMFVLCTMNSVESVHCILWVEGCVRTDSEMNQIVHTHTQQSCVE